MLQWHVAQERGGRDHQEDRHHVVVDEDHILVAGVYDGHGNATISTSLSNEEYGLAPALMLWREKHGRFPTDVNEEAATAFHQMDRLLWHLWKQSQKSSDRKSSSGGSTAIVATLDGAHLTLYNVGDSRAVVVDATDGTVVMETKDHKPTRIDERARIVSKGGHVSERKDVARAASVFTKFGYATSRAFGDFELKKDFNERLLGGRDGRGGDENVEEPPPTPVPDHNGVMSATPEVYEGELDLERRHYIVLASDGLWDVIDAEDVSEWVRDQTKKRDKDDDQCDMSNRLTQWLMDEALERDTTDNVTILVLEVGEPNEVCLARMAHSVLHMLDRLQTLENRL